MDFIVELIIICFGYKIFFNYGGIIGEMKLENVFVGFNIEVEV